MLGETERKLVLTSTPAALRGIAERRGSFRASQQLAGRNTHGFVIDRIKRIKRNKP
jgi:hypothetical protein